MTPAGSLQRSSRARRRSRSPATAAAGVRGGPSTAHGNDAPPDPTAPCTVTLSGALSGVLHYESTLGMGGQDRRRRAVHRATTDENMTWGIGLGFPGAGRDLTGAGADGTFTLIVTSSFQTWSVDASRDPPLGSFTFTVTSLTDPTPRPTPFYGTTYEPYGSIPRGAEG